LRKKAFSAGNAQPGAGCSRPSASKYGGLRHNVDFYVFGDEDRPGPFPSLLSTEGEAKNGGFEPFLYKCDLFTKTGSGVSRGQCIQI
jgi:hypothetical protein